MFELELDGWDIFVIALFMIMITVGPIILTGITGGVSGKLTHRASVGKGTLIGMGVGLLTLGICWTWILAGPEPYRGNFVFILISLTNVVGMVTTVVLVRRTRS